MSAGNGHQHMMGPGQDSPRKVKEPHMMVVPSPGTPRRHTKLKITGATQTNSGVLVQGAEQLSVFTSPSPQRSVSSLGMQGVSGRLLSDTTKERLLASQRRSPQTSGYTMNRQRRLSRDRPAMPQVLSISSGQGGAGSEYFSDSNDSLYSGPGESNNSGHQQQQGFKLWLQQQHQATVHTGAPANSNSADSNNMRTANSLDSLDTVTSSIQQARASSLQRQTDQWAASGASPQLLRINRSNSMSTRMAAEQTDFQRTFPIRKPSGGGETQQSEYYGVPLALWSNSPGIISHETPPPRSQAAGAGAGGGHPGDSSGKSQPTSPSVSHRNSSVSKHNYETSRSVPRSYKRHEARQTGLQPPDAAKTRDEGHGSLSSLASLGHFSSVSFISEEKTNLEIQKLRQELREEHDKVKRLQSQLSTNVHVVSAFEQSLANMTSRLSQLTLTAEEKDRELQELRKTIENLRRQGARMYLENADGTRNSSAVTSFTSDSDNDDSPVSAAVKKPLNFKQRKSKWLKQSLSKAFARSRKPSGSVSELEDGDQRRSALITADVGTSCPGSPTARGHHRSKSASMLDECDKGNVERLQAQLLRKDSQLTESRLEALSSAHQLHTLRETVASLRGEMTRLKAENERMYTGRASNGAAESPRKRYNNGSGAGQTKKDLRICETGGDKKGCSLLQISCSLETDLDEVLVPVSVISTGHLARPEVRIGHVTISRHSSWVHLDDCLRGLVRTYLAMLDPDNSLELSNQSMVCYQCGNIRRVFKNPEPERRPSVLPDTRIWVSFRGGTDRGSMEDLSFISLLPRSTLQAWTGMMTKHQRIVISGPSGSGKSFLATKMAEFLVLRSGEELRPDSVVSFRADRASAQECSDFVANMTGRGKSGGTVVIIDNIHHQGSKIMQIFSKLETTIEETPFIICTSHQTEYLSDLVETFNFGEITLGNDVELLQGLLGRYLRRKMLNIEVGSKLANLEMPEAIQWMLRIYCNLYIFVKTTSGTASFLSPAVFMPCPVDSTAQLREWFIDLWNSSLVSLLRQVVQAREREAGVRAAEDFEDPVRFVIRTWPWLDQADGLPQALLKVKTESRVLKAEQKQKEDKDEDPLLSMLLSLQQATLMSDDGGCPPRPRGSGRNSRGQSRNTSEAGNFDCEVTSEVMTSPGTAEDTG